jgi:hypothetical protein
MEGFSSASCSQRDCIQVYPFILFPAMKERKYVAFWIESLAIADVRFRDMNCLNLMRKSLVSLWSLWNFSGGLPSSHPPCIPLSASWGRSQMPKGSSPVPLGQHGSFPLVVNNCSLIPLSCSVLERTSLVAWDARQLHCSSAGVGSPLSTKLCKFIPVYRRCFTHSMAHAGLMVMNLFCHILTSNHTPP